MRRKILQLNTLKKNTKNKNPVNWKERKQLSEGELFPPKRIIQLLGALTNARLIGVVKGDHGEGSDATKLRLISEWHAIRGKRAEEVKKEDSDLLNVSASDLMQVQWSLWFLLYFIKFLCQFCVFKVFSWDLINSVSYWGFSRMFLRCEW